MMLGKGHNTKSIAKELNLSVKTVESYRAHINEKLEITDASEMACFAMTRETGASAARRRARVLYRAYLSPAHRDARSSSCPIAALGANLPRLSRKFTLLLPENQEILVGKKS
jgi:Bacterial regulatory proteins, luxR family